MLGDQGSPYVGRFARGWHRLPGFVPGQPQTRTGAPREYRHGFRVDASRVVRAAGPCGPERAARREQVDLACSCLDEGCGAGRGGRTRRQDIVDQEEPRRRRPMRDVCEDIRHRAQALFSAAAGLWSRVPRSANEGSRREAELPRERSREHGGLVEAALGPPPAGERYPRHGVGGRRADLGESGGERVADPPPSRELEAMNRLLRGSPIREGRAHGRDGRRGAIWAPIDVRARRPAAPAAPRRLQGDERARALLAEGPRAGAASRARPREQDVDRPFDHLLAHRGTLRRAADTPQGSGTSTGSAPLIEIVSTELGLHERVGEHGPGTASRCRRWCRARGGGPRSRTARSTFPSPRSGARRSRSCIRAGRSAPSRPSTTIDSPIRMSSRRVAPLGHGTANRAPGRTVSCAPSIATSHSIAYHPDASSATGNSNGTNRSRLGATSSVACGIPIGTGPRPASSTARASSSRTWCGFPSAPRITKDPFSDAGKRSKCARMRTASSRATFPLPSCGGTSPARR